MDATTYRLNLDHVMNMEFAAPAFEVVSGICPHLTTDAVRELLVRAESANDLVEFAVPSVLIANSYHVCGIAPPRKCASFLAYVRHKRTAGSSTDGTVRFDYPEPRTILFAQEALDFAKKAWSQNLIKDGWLAVHQYNLYNPMPLSGQVTSRCPLRPRLMQQIAVALNKSPSDMVADKSLPLVEQLDAAVAHVSHWQCEARELAGGRSIRAQNNCSCCGESLDLITCKTCGIDWQHPQEMPLPVPPKVEQYLRTLGHHFRSAKPA